MSERPDDVIVQELKPDGIIQTLRDGSKILVPYLKDENGDEYAELWFSHQIMTN